jgi:hypothetical protein
LKKVHKPSSPDVVDSFFLKKVCELSSPVERMKGKGKAKETEEENGQETEMRIGLSFEVYFY